MYKYLLLLVLFVNSLAGFAQPANDNCNNAINIPVAAAGVTCTSPVYTNTNATTEAYTSPSCWNTPSDNNVWFSFTAPASGSVMITDNFSTNTLNDPQAAVFSGTCGGGLTEIGCHEDMNTGAGVLYNRFAVYNMTPTAVYYIMIDGNNGETGDFGVCVSEIPPLDIPEYSDCNATQFICDANPITLASFNGSSGLKDEPGTCYGINPENRSHWYEFTAATNGVLKFKITPTNPIDYDWVLRDITNGCPGNEIDCNYTPCLGDPTWPDGDGVTGMGCANTVGCEDFIGPVGGPPCVPSVNVTAGRRYTLMVDRFDNGTDGFTLDFIGSTFQFGELPQPDFNITSGGCGDFTFNYLSPSGTLEYLWDFGDGAFATSINAIHNYSTPGNYDVTLQIKSLPGVCTNSITKSITVGDGTDIELPLIPEKCELDTIQLDTTSVALTSISDYYKSFENTTDINITSNNTVFSDITVNCLNPSDWSVERVCMNIDHTWMSDMQVRLVSPSGNFINLADRIGGSNDGYVNTCFENGQTGNRVNGGAAPYTGTWGPQQNPGDFRNFTGYDPNGAWRLRVNDNSGGDNGVIKDWTITFKSKNGIKSYSWTPVLGLSATDIPNPLAYPSVSTEYTLTIEEYNCCSGSEKVQLDVKKQPEVTIEDQNICEGDSADIILSITPNDDYDVVVNGGNGPYNLASVQNGSIFNTGALFANTTLTLISASYSNDLACLTDLKDEADITIRALPAAALIDDIKICNNTDTDIELDLGLDNYDVTISANGVNSNHNGIVDGYTFNTGNLTNTTTYRVESVTYDDSPFCSSVLTDSITVIVRPDPVVTVGIDTTLCYNTSGDFRIFLPTTGLYNIEYSDGTTTFPLNNVNGENVISVGPYTSDQTFEVTNISYNDAPNCQIIPTGISTDFTVRPELQLTFTGDATICEGDNVEITVDITGGLDPWEVDFTTDGGITNNTWVINASPFTENISPTQDSTFNITALRFADAPSCEIPLNETVTIIVNELKDAGEDGNGIACETETTVDLFVLLNGTPTLNGTWNDDDNTFGLSGADFNPSVPGPGTYEFTYSVLGDAPCPSGTSIVSVEVIVKPLSGTASLLTACTDDPAFSLFTGLTGHDLTGAWYNGATPITDNFNPGAYIGGTYNFTYTVTGTSPCADASTLVIVELDDKPYAGNNREVSYCETLTSADLFAELGGFNKGTNGTWSDGGQPGSINTGTGELNPSLLAPGTYTYTYTVPATAHCSSDDADVIVEIVRTPIAGDDVTMSACNGDNTAIDLFDQLEALSATAPDSPGSWYNITDGANVPSGTFNPNGRDTISYVLEYTVAALSPCAANKALLTLTIEDQPYAGKNGSAKTCNLKTDFSLFSGLNGREIDIKIGFWLDLSSTGALSGDQNKTFDASSVADGDYLFGFLTPATAPCSNDTAFVTITVSGQPDAGDDATIEICNDQIVDLFSQLGGTPDAGGVWTDKADGTGSVVDPATFDANRVATDTYEFRYDLSADTPCLAANALVSIKVNAQPDPGTDGAITVCDGDNSFNLFDQLNGTPDASGAWTNTGGSSVNNTFNPANDASGTYTYTPTIPNQCQVVTANVDVTVNSAPMVSAVETCEIDALNYRVELTVTGGDAASYAVVGSYVKGAEAPAPVNGIWAGNVFTSDLIPT
ncbi:MAG: subtilisin-like proprotein convertase family protein, partial [Flavobacteriales bacterium]